MYTPREKVRKKIEKPNKKGRKPNTNPVNQEFKNFIVTATLSKMKVKLTPVVVALRRLRWKDLKFEVSLGDVERPLKK